MYRSKAQGRNAYQAFEPEMQRAIQMRLQLERELRDAIAQDNLVLHYQPQVDCSGTIRGLEALVRWAHPVKGLIMPGEFIGVAEQTGLIVQLSRWVMIQASRDLESMKRRLPAARCPAIAINISANDFRRGGLLDMIQEIAAAPSFQKGDFCLELTEHTVMENHAAVVEIMHCARKLGFSFAIDDFGTGHSSLACLKLLPVDVLKIDRSFVQDILDDANDMVIVQTIIGMAENLGLETVAEGVETMQIHEALRRFGCRYFQGWHCGRPEPMKAIVQRLQNCPTAEAMASTDVVAGDAKEICPTV
jgi:EAL domain-containing protein (putative c-di-GMP-specific phosphodiesterase class I)